MCPAKLGVSGEPALSVPGRVLAATLCYQAAAERGLRPWLRAALQHPAALGFGEAGEQEMDNNAGRDGGVKLSVLGQALGGIKLAETCH